MNVIVKLMKQLYKIFLDLLYPEDGVCFICDQYDGSVDDKHICSECHKKLIYIGNHICSVCGKPLEKGYIPEKCSECIKDSHYFKRALAPLDYTGIIKESIYRFKYGKKSYIYKALGPFLVQAIKDYNVKSIDLIVPVPLHKSKKIDRGFNQAELLGMYISEKLNIPQDTKNLARLKSTKIQNKLNKSERMKNVKNALKIIKNEVFKEKSILLIDDIFTTGATVDECSRILLKAGAKEVIVLTVARGSGNK